MLPWDRTEASNEVREAVAYLARRPGPSWGSVWVAEGHRASVWPWGTGTGTSWPSARPRWGRRSPQVWSPDATNKERISKKKTRLQPTSVCMKSCSIQTYVHIQIHVYIQTTMSQLESKGSGEVAWRCNWLVSKKCCCKHEMSRAVIWCWKPHRWKYLLADLHAHQRAFSHLVKIYRLIFFPFVPTKAEEEEKETRTTSQTDRGNHRGTCWHAMLCQAVPSCANQAEVERNKVQILCCCSEVDILCTFVYKSLYFLPLTLYEHAGYFCV